ncbi:PAS domain-containing sensor histidine kinase [Fulvivirga ligni]|uniref:PAS domain-containing sensor histidine kinase n=1 Tax=Fulvivirga ligni TaxID=2904246 RepID=UPI001F3F5CF5|nr:PAS domain-containing sensor histidine kinase [Fulvivirga ligni]UII22025.1 PAS domain-containing sensor histidine kinase [Fulvivirga ligni]
MNELDSSRILIDNLIELNAEAILVIDSTLSVLAWNKRLEELTGLPKSLSVSRKVDKVLTLWDQECSKCAIEAFASKNSVCCTLYTIDTPTTSHTVSLSFSPTRLSDEDAALCMIILREVTPKRIIKSKFQPLVEESPLATCIFRPDGNIQYFNKAFSTLWGTSEKLTGQILKSYNILEDTQLLEHGIMPFLQKGFAGEVSEIPPTYYNPFDSEAAKAPTPIVNRYIRGHIYPVKNEVGQIQEVVIILSDITFQKQAEQILTETHLKFQMLTLGLPGVIYELEEKLDGTSSFKYISHGCEEMFGVSPEEVRNNPLLLDSLIHPEDHATFYDSSNNARVQLKDWEWEGRLLIEGKEKWIEGKSSPTKKKNGTVVRYGLLLDITDKKEVERRYKLSEERLKLALQGAELALWEWEVEDKKTIFNNSWVSKLGYEPNELELTMTEWLALIHPEDAKDVHQLLHNHISKKTSYYEAEYRFKTKRGSYRWILDRGRVVQWSDDNQPVKLTGTYLDINDKKTSEILVQKNELLFTQLFENSPLGIVLLDDQHCVMQMNQGFKDMFGFSEEAIVGNQLNNILVPKDYEKEAIDINTLTASGQVGMLESYRLHADGHTVPVIIYGVPVSFENKTIGIYGIYVDITDRTKAEQELQIRNNELDNFVYKVSHDLRAPLSSILGLVNLANYEQNEDDLHHYISLIENRVKQLDSFINDVLSHSKNLKLAVSLGEINFNQVVDDCFSDLNYLPKASKVKKFIEISSYPFYSDKWRINEIFRNLISNAIKYLDPEKEEPFVKMHIAVTDEMAHIRFEDNGIGIEEDTLPKVFEMFYRATEYSEGSGIGLYIVKNAVERLGGQIRVHSEIGVGTIFDILIPNAITEAKSRKNE